VHSHMGTHTEVRSTCTVSYQDVHQYDVDDPPAVLEFAVPCLRYFLATTMVPAMRWVWDDCSTQWLLVVGMHAELALFRMCEEREA
jgi:hypothetical protein